MSSNASQTYLKFCFLNFILLATVMSGGCNKKITGSIGGLGGSSEPSPIGLAKSQTNHSEAKELNVYFVRHAESMANFTGHYSNASENSFSPRGKQQLLALPKKVENLQFDSAIVSPAWRTMETASVILKSKGITGTIWPELYECCSQRGAARNIPPSPKMRFGRKIQIPIELESYLNLDPSDQLWILPGDYQDGMRQMDRLYKKFMEKYGGKAENVLVVGHGFQGSIFLSKLLGFKKLDNFRFANASIVHLQQQPDGTFKVISLGGSIIRGGSHPKR